MRRRDSAAVNRISRVCWTTMAAIMELPCGQHLITLISGPIQGTTFRSRRLREPRPTVVDGFRRSKPIRRRTEYVTQLLGYVYPSWSLVASLICHFPPS